jgi:hypothetical protein
MFSSKPTEEAKKDDAPTEEAVKQAEVTET